MKLKDLAKKPELIEIVLDDADTVKEFNEPITFHTWDRAPLDVFTKLASANQASAGEMVDIVRTLILDEKGNQVIKNDQMLPPALLIRAISKIVTKLGN